MNNNNKQNEEIEIQKSLKDYLEKYGDYKFDKLNHTLSVNIMYDYQEIVLGNFKVNYWYPKIKSDDCDRIIKLVRNYYNNYGRNEAFEFLHDVVINMMYED